MHRKSRAVVMLSIHTATRTLIYSEAVMNLKTVKRTLLHEKHNRKSIQRRKHKPGK